MYNIVQSWSVNSQLEGVIHRFRLKPKADLWLKNEHKMVGSEDCKEGKEKLNN